MSKRVMISQPMVGKTEEEIFEARFRAIGELKKIEELIREKFRITIESTIASIQNYKHHG